MDVDYKLLKRREQWLTMEIVLNWIQQKRRILKLNPKFWDKGFVYVDVDMCTDFFC